MNMKEKDEGERLIKHGKKQQQKQDKGEGWGGDSNITFNKIFF